MRVNNQAIRFLVAGGLAAVANFFSRGLFEQFSPFWVAVILSYLVGMAVAFYLNRKFVFKDSSGSIRSSIIRFVLVNLLAGFQVWVISISMQYWILPLFEVVLYREEIAHAVGICFPIFTSFVAHKRWTFR